MSFSFASNSFKRKKAKRPEQSRRGAVKAESRINLQLDLNSNDDGFESFGIFNTNPTRKNKLKRTRSIETPRVSRKPDQQPKVPSMEDVLKTLSAKEKARSMKSSVVPHVTPLSAKARRQKKLKSNANDAIRVRRVASNKIGANNSNQKQTQIQKRLSRHSQTGIHAFFTKASKLESKVADADIEVDKKKTNFIVPVDKVSDRKAATETFKIHSPFTSIHPPSRSTTPTVVPYESAKLSNLKSTAHITEEIVSENNLVSKDEKIDRKEVRRRRKNKRVFNGKMNSNHLLAQLNRRSTFNTRHDRYVDSGYHGMRNKVHEKCWHPNLNVLLDRGSFTSEITCMEFDSEGVLLAVADSVGVISIFDFDEVNAADMEMKRRRKGNVPINSNGATGANRVKPFINFRMGADIHRISSIQWNPFDENMLAVTCFNKGEVRIFDVSATSESGPLCVRLFDRKARNQTRNVGNWKVQFLPSKLNHKILIGGSDGTLSMWQFPFISSSVTGNQGRLIWSVNPWKVTNTGRCGGLTEIVNLSRNSAEDGSCHVLVATSMGWFSLLDINKCSRKSFSSDLTPQVMKTWSLSQLGGIRKNVLPGSKWMGVEKVYILANRYDSMKSSVKLAVISSGGWIFQMHFDLSRNNMNIPTARVLHRSPTIVKCNSSRSEFYKDSTPSVPEFASVHGKLDEAANMIVVTKTKTIYQVLPDSDKRTLDQSIANSGLMQSISEETGGLTIFNMANGNQMTVPIKGKLKHLVIHPDNEWMAASMLVSNGSQTSSVVKLMNLRSTKRRSIKIH